MQPRLEFKRKGLTIRETWEKEKLLTMSTKRKIKAVEIVSDIRLGMTNPQLMDKYKVSEANLSHIFKMLIDTHSIEQGGLEQLLSPPPAKLDVSDRSAMRGNYMFIRLPIHDMKNPLNKGIVADISETNLKISGISVKVGDTMEFFVHTDYFADISPFAFEAQCQWASKSEDSKLFSGFDITSISKEGLDEIRRIVRSLTVLDAKINVR